MARTYVFDLDGTLCTNTEGDYEDARPLPWAIERVNALRRAGHHITVFTARGTKTGIDWRELTERQLRAWGVEFDDLQLGKPYGEVYIDDKALHVDAWRFGHAGELTGPGHAPPRAAAVIEVARTFGGRLFRPGEHAEALLASARAAGLAVAHTREDVAGALGASAREVAADDDLVLVLSLSGPPHAAFLDTADGPAEGELLVTARLLSQVTRALGTPEVRASTRGDATAWPLSADLRDLRGGELAAVRDGALLLRPEARGVAVEVARQAGLEVAVGEIDRNAGELLLLGAPFCVLPVVELDGRPVGTGRPGDACRAIAAAWSDETGVDVAAQLAALAS